MAEIAIIIQILFISLGMVLIGLIFNKIFGLSQSYLSEFREKAKNLQDRMKLAQQMGDYQLMRQLQAESLQLSKEMMKKQFVPLCIRCILFIGIFALIGFIYADYSAGLLPFPILFFGSGWFALYFLFSIGFTLLIWIGKKIYKKYISEEDTRSMTQEVMGMLSNSSPNIPSSGLDFSSSPSGNTQNENVMMDKTDEKSNIPDKKDSWKDKLDL